MELYGHDRAGWPARWHVVADWFLLACFTGLRVSDIASLRWSDVRDGALVVVMQWTGHRNYSSLKPYIAVSDTERARQMAKFDAMG